MINLPLLLILLGAVYLAVRHGKSSAGGMVLGVSLGLAMASTSVGPTLVRGLTALSTTVIRAISSSFGNV